MITELSLPNSLVNTLKTTFLWFLRQPAGHSTCPVSPLHLQTWLIFVDNCCALRAANSSAPFSVCDTPEPTHRSTPVKRTNQQLNKTVWEVTRLSPAIRHKVREPENPELLFYVGALQFSQSSPLAARTSQKAASDGLQILEAEKAVCQQRVLIAALWKEVIKYLFCECWWSVRTAPSSVKITKSQSTNIQRKSEFDNK